MKDGKGMALLAMLAPKKGKSVVEDEDDEHEGSDSEMEDEGAKAAAEDILAAFEAKDAEALSEALKSHYAFCKS